MLVLLMGLWSKRVDRLLLSCSKQMLKASRAICWRMLLNQGERGWRGSVEPVGGSGAERAGRWVDYFSLFYIDGKATVYRRTMPATVSWLPSLLVIEAGSS